MSVGGSRKASFTSSTGTGSGAYYQHPHLYPSSISKRTSTDSATTTTDSSVMSDAGSIAVSMTEDELMGYRSPFIRQDLAQVFGNEEKDRAPSTAPSETGSGRLSRSSRSCWKSGSQLDGNSPLKDEPTLGRERHGSTSSRGHGQTASAEGTNAETASPPSRSYRLASSAIHDI
jgi:hypothetical protein